MIAGSKMFLLQVLAAFFNRARMAFLQAFNSVGDTFVPMSDTLVTVWFVGILSRGF